MTFKKILRYIVTPVLVVGASIILGFLSFSGIYILLPLLPLAIAAFILSVGFEGEVYYQNIKDSIKNLFNPSYTKQQLAREFLKEILPGIQEVLITEQKEREEPIKPETEEQVTLRMKEVGGFAKKASKTKSSSIPKFFQDYINVLTLIHNYNHQNLKLESLKQKKQLKIILATLEKIFAEQLFLDDNKKTGVSKELYIKELQQYLIENNKEAWVNKLPRRNILNTGAKVLSIISGIFMILGTTYLLVEAFAVVPFLSTIPFAVLPALVVPMAVIAGTAFGVLTYNSLDELIKNDILQRRITKIREDIKNGLTFYTTFKILAFIAIFVLSITLTVCTAGTWLTILRHTKPIFSWLGKMPKAVATSIAVVLGTASLAFNLSNSATTMEEIEDLLESDPEYHPYHIKLLTNTDSDLKSSPQTGATIIKKEGKYHIYGCNNMDAENPHWQYTEIKENAYFSLTILNFIKFDKDVLKFSMRNLAIYLVIKLNNAHTFIPSKENMLQFLNPFRALLLITYLPLRVLLFLGHLISISATSDRLPGVNEIISMLIAFTSEFFEDLHYFVSFQNENKEDIDSLLDEHFNNDTGCNHQNDFPTYCLKILFYPLFYLAAWWDSGFKDDKTTELTFNFTELLADPITVANNCYETWLNPSEEFSDSLSKLTGTKKKTEVVLEENDKEYAKGIIEPISTLQEEEEELTTIETESLISKLSVFRHPSTVTCASNCCNPSQIRMAV